MPHGLAGPDDSAYKEDGISSLELPFSTKFLTEHEKYLESATCSSFQKEIGGEVRDAEAKTRTKIFWGIL